MSLPESQPPDEDPVTELALRWEELRERGAEVPPEELCAGHPEWVEPLRRRLQALRDMDAVLETSAGRPAPAPPLSFGARFTAPPRALLLPQVPGYEVLGELGRGGMGIVYKARQLAPDRLVALKMILPRMRPRAAELIRFRREVETITSLQHPNLVAIYEVGEHGDRPYYALEYVDGGSLERQAGDRPHPPAQAAELVQTLARAMHAVHGRGIVHRDLKPANVLLAGAGGVLPAGPDPPLTAWTPKVSDFGLARRVASQDGPTLSGAVLGTPGYMAPEQAAGRSRDVGPAADVYALGAILYRLLTGRPPFQAPTPFETIRLVAAGEVVPPTRREPGCPPDLELICLKCLEKDPGRRYTTAEDLADDLRRFQGGEPIRNRSAGPLGRLVRSAWRALRSRRGAGP
jgi:eukaryotic-like serine/threonine-protein kinase